MKNLLIIFLVFRLVCTLVFVSVVCASGIYAQKNDLPVMKES